MTDGQLFSFLRSGGGILRNVYVFRKPNRQMRELMRDVRLVFISDIVRESADSPNNNGLGVKMLAIGEASAEGKSLAEIQQMFSCPTDITGMLTEPPSAKDLLSHWRTTWIDMPERRAHRIDEICERDEVEVVDLCSICVRCRGWLL